MTIDIDNLVGACYVVAKIREGGAVMKKDELLQLAEEARKALASETPIRGWGLGEPPEKLKEWFTRVVVAPASGCTTSTCSHFSHDPASPVAAWVPAAGVSVRQLGRELAEYGITTYFLVTKGDEVVFLELFEPEHYRARAYTVKPEELPTWVLARVPTGE